MEIQNGEKQNGYLKFFKLKYGAEKLLFKLPII